MGEQLHLEPVKLKEIGFIEKTIKSKDVYDNMEVDTVVYTIPFINGYFSYNPHDEIYTWYSVVIIDGKYNHVHLNIQCIGDLYKLLTIFRVCYRGIYLD